MPLWNSNRYGDNLEFSQRFVRITIAMITPFVLVLLAVIFIARPSFILTPVPEYTSRERTSLINGIFIWLVIFSHMYNNGVLLNDTDQQIIDGIRDLKQLVISTFLFFTGYGIMSSLIRKGKDYAACLISKRFFSVLFHFSIVVLVYVAVQYSLGNTFPLTQIIAGFTGWLSIVPSSWYIFLILISYWFIAISWHLCHRFHPIFQVISVSILYIIYIPCVMDRGYWWADSCLCVPAGMLYRIYQPNIERFLKSIRIPACIIGILLIIAGHFVYRRFLQCDGLSDWISDTMLCKMYVQNWGCIIFALGILWFLSNIKFARKPTFLVWCGGTGVFFLYVFHELFMLLGIHLGLNYEHPTTYQAMCIILTLVLAWLFCKIMPRLDALIWLDKESHKNEVLHSHGNLPTRTLALRRKWLFVPGLACIICSLSGLYYVWIPRGIKVNLQLASDQIATCRIHYSASPKHKYTHTAMQTCQGMSELSFFLPAKKVSRMQLDFGKNADKVKLTAIRIEGRDCIEWSAADKSATPQASKVKRDCNNFILESNHKKSRIVYTAPSPLRAGAERRFQPYPFFLILLGTGGFCLMLLDVYVKRRGAAPAKPHARK